MHYRKSLSGRFTTFAAAGSIWAALSLVLGLSSQVRADVPDGPARPGEIVLKVAAGMGDSDAQALADKVNFKLAGAIPFAPGYYKLIEKAPTRAAQTTPSVVKRRGRAVYIPFTATFKAAVETLRAVPGVLADPNYIELFHQTTPSGAAATIQPNDPYYQLGSAISASGQVWNYGIINMPQAWAIQTNGVGRTVLAADIDSGIDPTHPDLVNKISPLSLDLDTRDAQGNIVPSPVLFDREGHGTHTAGTIGAETNNSLGVASVSGWNQGGIDVKIVAYRGGDAGIAVDSQIAAFMALAANGVDVVNMSFGGSVDIPTRHSALIAAYNTGVTFVGSAGNSGADDLGNPDPVGGTVPNYPASYPEVINVSAVGPEKRLAFYSSYGSNVAVTAPGGDDPTYTDPTHLVVSTFPLALTSPAGYAQSPIRGYTAIQGTSMAAPHVTGAVALLIACGGPRNPVLVKQILQSTAQALPDEKPSLSGGKYGAGLIDVYAAILPFTNPPFAVSVPGTTAASTLSGVSSQAAIAAGDVPFIDRGQTYSSQQAPIAIQVVGVSRKAATDVVTVEIQTATTPSTTLRTYSSADTSANGIVIPTLPAGVPKGTSFTVAIPGTGGTPITVPDGRYRAVVKFNGVIQGIIFFEKVSRSQPQGRVLFSTPFQVRQVDASTPEQTLFGPGTVFSLARYNPLRLPSDFDYALFQSGGGRSDAQARFNATALNGEPLSFDTSNPSASIAPVGLGYWLKLGSSVILNTSGAVVTNPVGVRCYASSGGWNMIGDPYPFAVSWGTVTVAANGQTYSLTDAVNARILSGALVSFPNGDYQYDVAPAGTLAPFNGYWIRVFQDCTIIIAPTGGTNGSGRAVKMSAGTASPLTNGWKVRLAASVAGDRDGQNFFGQVKSANKSRFVLPKPPSGAGHAYLRFVDNNASAGRATATGAVSNSGPMAFDLRPAASGSDGTSRESWTAEVSTDKPNTDVVLTWDGLGTAPRRAGLYLTDTATGRKVSLRDRSSYTYKSGEAGSTRSFVVTMEPTHTGGPLAITNLSVSRFGKAVGGGLAIRFGTTRDADVTGTIRTLSGQVVGVLSGASRAAASTTTTLHWTGRAQNGAALPAGAYQLEVTVRDADGSTATAKQTVQTLR